MTIDANKEDRRQPTKSCGVGKNGAEKRCARYRDPEDLDTSKGDRDHNIIIYLLVQVVHEEILQSIVGQFVSQL